MMKKQLLIAGGSGMIGSALGETAYSDGWEVTILSRYKGAASISWDPMKGIISMTEPLHFDAIVNLTGASISGARWTNKRKREIVNSRINASQTLEAYLRKGLLTTNVYIGVSGIGIYGDRRNAMVDEETKITSGNDWMIETVQEWEASHKRMEALDIRTVILRTAIVLSTKGGALREILRTTPFGIVGYFGNGNQIWPWIHIDDHIGIILHAINDEKVHGTYLATSPYPVPNKEMVQTIGRQYSPCRLVVPVPRIFLSIVLGEMNIVLLQNCPAFPTRLVKEGFKFRFATIEEAIKDLMKT
jgi:uncharacterized protein (TIGR01777 family)